MRSFKEVDGGGVKAHSNGRGRLCLP